MSELKIGRGLRLPAEIAGEAVGILAKRGAGKTNTAKVVVEELLDQRVQAVVLDPVGVWWGLRSSADGGVGYPVAVLGGGHGDVPLEAASGGLIAEVVVESGQSLVLDVSEFTKTEQRRFVADFATRLYRRKASSRSLLHVVLEEADEFAPQRVSAGDAPMVGAISLIVKRGRSRGIGLTFVTQRSASLNKDVLDQADVLIAMRTTGPRDRKAIEGWIEHQDADGAEDVLPSLPGLTTGEAWVWNPERGMLKRTQVRKARTFDTSATPGAGGRRAEPRAVAPIDLDALGAKIRETAERAKENDPRELHRKIRDLQKQLAVRPTSEPEQIEVRVPIEVPVLSDDQIERLEDRLAEARDLALGIEEAAATLKASVPAALRSAAEQIATALDRVRRDGKAALGQAEVRERRRPLQTPAAAVPARRPAPAPPDIDGVRLGKGERKVLEILAEYPEGRSYNELAFLAGYSAKASTLGVILSNLRKGGLVEPGNQPVRPTEAGLEAAGGVRERPTGQALLDQWMQHPRMGEGERKVLTALLDFYPNVPTHEELCEVTGYSPIASTMGVILSKLRKLGLVAKGQRKLADEFVAAIEEAHV